ncbi:histidine kinase [Noviherbaspirillum sp. ST9]|uniref:sensor histidine kinase n=1 Tax=Noviherbaspirillum sp. ST9 TaxID=3401606 RepID=UPI003B58A658
MSCSVSQKPVSLAALLVLGAGLALTGILSVWLATSEAHQHRNAFEQAAVARQAAFQQSFDDALHGLTLVNSLFSGGDEVNRRQFLDVATRLAELYPYVQVFSFVRIDSADSKRRYYVVDQVAPADGNLHARGMDISPFLEKDPALERVQFTGLPSATRMFTLRPEAGGKRAFAVMMPVYRNGDRGDIVIGYNAVVLRAQEFVERVLQRAALMDAPDIDVSIFVDNGQETEFVYSTTRQAPVQSEVKAEPGTHAASITRHVDAAGVRWLIVSTPAKGASETSYSSAWMALAGGMSFSILLALYLQSLAVQAAYLARSNARLTQDIDARKRIESALRASEERFERLTRMSSDWYWEQDAEFRFTMISGETIFGDTPTRELIGKTRSDMPLEVDEKDFEEHLQVLKSHRPFSNLEYCIRNKRGRVHWMSVSGEPLLGANGEFLGYRGTGRDITARKEAEQALRQSQTELRELAAHQARVKEDERKRIAREIHDDLGQNLLALRIDVSLLESETRQAHSTINERLHGLLSQVDNVVRSIRAIINDLRPPVLDLGLQCAFEWQVQQFRQRSGVSCTLEIEGGDIDGMLDEEAATSVFRILQESLTNVSRHAYATHVDIRLKRKYDGLEIEISDDGVGGFPGNMRKPRSFGLIGIRERIYTLGGEFRMASAPGKGTTLTITIPASATSAAAA